MPTIKKHQASDRTVSAIEKALQGIRRLHPDAEVEVRRYNAHSIRVRILARSFGPLSRTERDSRAWRFLDTLPEDTVQLITMLLLLTPEEAKHSLVNAEFEDPSPSLL